MGISNNEAKFLFYSKKLGVSFEKTLTLGRQRLYADKKSIKSFIKKYNEDKQEINEIGTNHQYSEVLFKLLGAKTITSLDYSNYEGANFIHDLNHPIPSELKNQFSVVLDSGTIEHIFNFPTAIQSCMEALEVGGHYIGITPGNNLFGHGFYQFSPELYFRIFDENNGFKLKLMACCTEKKDYWYKIKDPAEVRARIQLVNSLPITLLVVAEKIKSAEIFATYPQQSDYVHSWKVTEELKRKGKLEADNFVMSWYRKLPPYIRIFIRKIHDLIFLRKTYVKGLGKINPQHFERIEF